MPEPMSWTLGTLIAKWALRAWLKDSLFEDPATDVADVIRTKILDSRSQRQVRRDLEEVAELVADRLEPFISGELTGLSESDGAAAALGVEHTLRRGLSNSELLVKSDLDPLSFERELRRLDVGESDASSLGEAAGGVYDLLLTEACNYVVQCAGTLPDFQLAVSRELLKRNRWLLEEMRSAIERMPSARVPLGWHGSNEDDRFANQYIKAAADKADELQLFGAELPDGRSKYSLSVAYISLSVSAPTSGGGAHRASPAAPDSLQPDSLQELTDRPDPSQEAEDAVLRVESALGGHNRIVITGGAGSGKTTLLQWLTVAACGSLFVGSLEPWNGLTPVVLPLRRYAGRDLPGPESFLKQTHPMLHGAMPDGWMHRLLAAGEALVLVDGLDELPQEERARAFDWFSELLRTYPACKYVLTARPMAVSREWTQLPDFRYTELLPMMKADIRAFISHWHDAAIMAAAESGEADEQLRSAERHMLAAVNDQPAIRSMCTTPLLCALICALHRSKVNQLPENRMDLYETALKMLISERDREREIHGLGAAQLPYAQKLALLKGFALWVHETGRSDASIEDFRDVVARLAATLTRRKYPPEQIAEALLSRSGVLRQPVEGRVDFVHRTFLEYLAAAELVDQAGIDKLIMHCEYDAWREVIVLAAGHAAPVQRERLINGLIEFGEQEGNNKHRAYLLAVGCMETSPVLEEGTVTRILQCLDEVLPPTNMTEAAAVASAGELAVGRLGAFKRTVREAAPCVRALTLIGTDSALEALKAYADDDRVTVSRQIIRGWGQFDTGKYVQEVLRHSPLDNGFIHIADPEHAQHLSELPLLRAAWLDFTGRVDTLASIPGDPRVVGLDVSHARAITDLEEIGRFPGLRDLYMQGVRSLVSLRGVSQLDEISRITCSGSTSLAEVEELDELDDLAFLSLRDTSIAEYPLRSIFVDTLILGASLELKSLRNAVRARRVTVHYAPNLDSLDGLGVSDEIEHLTLSLAGNQAGEIPLPANAKKLDLNGLLPGEGYPRLVGGESIEQMSVWGHAILDVLENGPSMPHLRTLSVRMFEPTMRLDVLDKYEGLEQLEVVRSPGMQVPDIPGFELTEGRARFRAVYIRRR